MAVASIEGANELAAPLDLLLASSAIGVAERMMPNTSWSRFALTLARQPVAVASRATTLRRELVSIAEGRSQLAPAKGDKRFADPARRGNPLLERTMLAHRAANNTVNQLFSDSKLNWRNAERVRFALDVLTEGLSPSINPLLNNPKQPPGLIRLGTTPTRGGRTSWPGLARATARRRPRRTRSAPPACCRSSCSAQLCA